MTITNPGDLLELLYLSAEREVLFVVVPVPLHLTAHLGVNTSLHALSEVVTLLLLTGMLVPVELGVPRLPHVHQVKVPALVQRSVRFPLQSDVRECCRVEGCQVILRVVNEHVVSEGRVEAEPDEVVLHMGAHLLSEPKSVTLAQEDRRHIRDPD